MNDLNDIQKMFYSAKKYFLVDVFCGKPKISNINIEKIFNSEYNLNNRQEVNIISKSKQINSTTGETTYVPVMQSAFIKSSKEQINDDLDIVFSEIANLFGIKSSKVYRLLTENNIKGTININVKKQDESQISIDKLIKNTISRIKSEKLSVPEWLKDYISLPETNENNAINNIGKLNIIMSLSLELIFYNFQLNESEKEELTKDYVRMLLFDLISNQNIRTLNTYSILVNNKSYKPRFSPIYDYNNELNSSKTMILNNKYITKSCLLDCLFEYYYKYIKEITRGLIENLSAYKESIDLIIKSNVNEENTAILEKIITENIDMISKPEKEKINAYGYSKIDMALTKTSINLNAVNKNQQVRNKYEKVMSNKEEIKVPEEEIKIIVEESPKSKKGSNLLIILIGLSIVCMLGVGLAILLYNLNS